MHRLSWPFPPVYFFAIVASVIISLIANFSGSLLNTDGVCYLLSAETMSQGLSQAMQLCPQAKWPFFSMLIASIAYLTKLSYLNSAYLLDGFFSAMSVVIFIKIISFIQKSAVPLLWFAAIVILCFNEFNSVKYYVVRDHGFWAFYLLSIFMLLYFFQYPYWRYATAWFLSLVVATLFRVEGAVFLMLVPLAIFFHKNFPWITRLKLFFKLNAFSIISCVFLIGWVWVASPNSLGRLNEVFAQVTQGFSQLATDFHIRTQLLSQHILNPYSARYASWILLLTLVIWYLIAVIKNVSFAYAMLAIYAWFKRLLGPQLVLWAYVLVNVVITGLFLAEHMFLSKRYLIALSLTIMFWAPFALNFLYTRWPQRKFILSIAMILIFISSLGGIFQFGYSRQYVREAGYWLSDNVPNNAKIFSNDMLVMYYSHRFNLKLFENERLFKNIPLAVQNLKQYDYFALRVSKETKELILPLLKAFKNEKPVQVFANKRGDRVVIYGNLSLSGLDMAGDRK